MTENDNKRPLSPHLTIYKPQITSLTSISHRFSGIFLFIGALFLVWWIVFSIYATHLVQPIMNFMSSVLGKLIIFAWSFAFFYHLLNGIRHLMWDIDKFFDMKSVRITGYIVILGSIALTLLSWKLAGSI